MNLNEPRVHEWQPRMLSEKNAALPEFFLPQIPSLLGARRSLRGSQMSQVVWTSVVHSSVHMGQI